MSRIKVTKRCHFWNTPPQLICCKRSLSLCRALDTTEFWPHLDSTRFWTTLSESHVRNDQGTIGLDDLCFIRAVMDRPYAERGLPSSNVWEDQSELGLNSPGGQE